MPRLHLILAALLFAGCAMTTPIGEWRNPDFSAKLDNILIIGVTERAERRREFEDAFVAALAASRVDATPSYELIESSANLTRTTVEQAIEGRPFDAVLVTRLAGIEQRSIERIPTGDRRYADFGGYYDHVVQQNNAGYYDSFRVFALETHVYDTASRQLIWSLQSEAFDSSQPRKMIADQIRLSIRMLEKQNLIGD